jgi:hypothetical protein
MKSFDGKSGKLKKTFQYEENVANTLDDDKMIIKIRRALADLYREFGEWQLAHSQLRAVLAATERYFAPGSLELAPHLQALGVAA